jgi:gamma-glutamylcyclotransferase (GGCT)/AIG2-like uncharacterized protein YtfP
MNKDGLYAFYGTLRRDMENHILFQRGMHYLDTVVLEGYKLISLVEYPYAVRTFNSNETITVELFHLDPVEAESIHHMELEAGYYYDEIQIGQNLYGIYLFSEINPEDEEIPSGDWAKYIAERDF